MQFLFGGGSREPDILDRVAKAKCASESITDVLASCEKTINELRAENERYRRATGLPPTAQVDQVVKTIENAVSSYQRSSWLQMELEKCKQELQRRDQSQNKQYAQYSSGVQYGGTFTFPAFNTVPTQPAKAVRVGGITPYVDDAKSLWEALRSQIGENNQGRFIVSFNKVLSTKDPVLNVSEADLWVFFRRKSSARSDVEDLLPEDKILRVFEGRLIVTIFLINDQNLNLASLKDQIRKVCEGKGLVALIFSCKSSHDGNSDVLDPTDDNREELKKLLSRF